MRGSLLERSTVLANFRIEGVLGRGATATVYEAVDLSVERRVALKLLGPELSSDPVFAARFRREGQLQASLEHPHVVPVYEAAESELGLYLAMRLVRGPTLATLILRHALGAARTLDLLGQVAGALDAAHAAGLVHRDVKPQNVLVDQSDHAYLADFGLTKLGRDEGVTIVGGIVGTLAYLAPEVIRGESASAASDRYSFAAMLFECLAGETVFPRGTEAALLYAHTNELAPPISEIRTDLPATLGEVLDEALAKDPRERPGSAVELIDATREAIGPERLARLGPPPPASSPASSATIVPIPAREPIRPEAAPEPSRRLRAVLPVLGAAVAGAAAAVAAIAAVGGLRSSPASDVPPIERGAIALGSALGAGAHSVSCSGAHLAAGTPNCTFAQLALPHRQLFAPQDGVIRRWSVRGARGELALQVLTDRDGRLHQLARSASAFVPDTRPHSYAADLALSQGDFVGVEPIGGAVVGVRSGVAGAGLVRWTPALSGNEIAISAGARRLGGEELQLRIDFVPGASPSSPAGEFGPAAAALPSGRAIARRRFRYRSGLAAALELVELGSRVVLDERRGGRRVARIDVPGLRPGGQLIAFNVDHSPAKQDEVGIFVEYVNQDSMLLVSHYFLVHPFDFAFVN